MRGSGVGGRGRGARRHHAVQDEIRATLVDHVINHGLTMAEAGRRVQPNVPRSTVSSIIQTFRRETGRPMYSFNNGITVLIVQFTVVFQLLYSNALQ